MSIMSLVAKLTLDKSGFDSGLDSAQSGFSKLGGTIKSGLATAAKVGTAAITAASGAVTALVGQSVSAYADFEQLVGGIETLFEDLSVDVSENAANAYKTAGLSANEYMETAISFAAALNNSLIESEGNIRRSADLTDQIIIDMSDNVNKMGTSMESIQNAYRGFSRGNFTMLDNLALGFAGTKEGMQQLLDKAQELEAAQGRYREFSIGSFADIADAIHIVQNDMGITGTTAREASETISGSLSSVKSAWQNLIVGFSNKDADIGALVTNVVDGAKTALGNLIPVAKQAIKGAAKAIREMAPVIAKELPGLISDILPDLLIAGKDFVIAIGKGLIASLPALIETGKTLLNELLDALGIGDKVREYFGKAKELWDEISGPISDAFDKIKTNVGAAFDRIKEALSPVIDKVSEFIQKIKDYLSSGEAMEDTTNFIADAADKLAEGISKVANFVATVVEKGREFVDWLNQGSAGAEALKAGVIALVTAFATYKAITLAVTIAQKALVIVQNAVAIAQKALNLVMSMNPIGLIITAIAALVAAFIYLWNNCDEFKQFWLDLWEGIKTAFNAVVEWLDQAIKDIVAWFTQAWEDIKNVWSAVSGFFEGIWNAIVGVFSAVGSWFAEKFETARDNVHNAFQKIGDWFGRRWTDIKNVFKSVGEWFQEKFQTAKDNILNVWSNIKEKFDEIWAKIKSAFDFSDAWNWGRDMIENFIGGIQAKWEALKEKVSGVGSLIHDLIGFSEPKKGPLSDFHTYAPDMIDLFIKGIKENEGRLRDTVERAFDFTGSISSRSSSGLNVGGMTVNVYGSDNMSVRELADEVERRIVSGMRTLSATYA